MLRTLICLFTTDYTNYTDSLLNNEKFIDMFYRWVLLIRVWELIEPTITLCYMTMKRRVRSKI